MPGLRDDSPAVGRGGGTPFRFSLVLACPTGVWRRRACFSCGPGRERADETPEGPDFDKPRVRARVMGARSSGSSFPFFLCGAREDVSAVGDAGRLVAVRVAGWGKRVEREEETWDGSCSFWGEIWERVKGSSA